MQDAKLYASWGIDYLKYDLCSFRQDVMAAKAPDDKAEQMRLMIAAYDKMGKALKDAAGRSSTRCASMAGMRRGSGRRRWAATYGVPRATCRPNWHSIYDIINQQAGLAKYAGPGHWNDPDMLEVGNGKLTLAENRAHFSMWAMLAAPLLAGNDLPNMKPEIKAILINKDVIAIDQDKLGREGTKAYADGESEVWTRRLAGGALAIAVLNVGYDRTSNHPIYLDLARLGLHGPLKGKDLWSGKDVTLTDHHARGTDQPRCDAGSHCGAEIDDALGNIRLPMVAA